MRRIVREQHVAIWSSVKIVARATGDEELQAALQSFGAIQPPLDCPNVFANRRLRAAPNRNNLLRERANVSMTREIPTASPKEMDRKPPQDGTKRSNPSDLPPRQTAAHHEHRKQVKESERDIVFEVPVD